MPGKEPLLPHALLGKALEGSVARGAGTGLPGGSLGWTCPPGPQSSPLYASLHGPCLSLMWGSWRRGPSSCCHRGLPSRDPTGSPWTPDVPPCQYPQPIPHPVGGVRIVVWEVREGTPHQASLRYSLGHCRGPHVGAGNGAGPGGQPILNSEPYDAA